MTWNLSRRTVQAIASGLVVLFVKICLALSFLLFLYLYAYEIFLINFIKEKGKEGFFFFNFQNFCEQSSAINGWERETWVSVPVGGEMGVWIYQGYLAPFSVKKESLWKWKLLSWTSCLVVSDSLQSRGLYNPWNSSGRNTRVGSLSLLRKIFPGSGSNPGLSRCVRILQRATSEALCVKVFSLTQSSHSTLLPASLRCFWEDS